MNNDLPISNTISIKEAGFNEEWLQNQIWENPSRIGLGDLESITKETAVSSGGRLDILLKDTETDTMYEVEVMLGETDPSHIIRTIEYWDLIRKKWPQRQHFGVLVAERITKRYFNVIQILSNNVPLIAIQANIIEIEDNKSLHFTKILDAYEEPEEDLIGTSENIDEAFWEKKSKSVLNIAKKIYEKTKDIYEESKIGLRAPLKTLIYSKEFPLFKIFAIVFSMGETMGKQKGFFDEDYRLSELKEHGDPLMKLNELIPWEQFRPLLQKIFYKQPKSPGGRPPYDYVMMFKILVLQRLYTLSDSQMQFQIMDRLSFMRFLGLNLNDRVPDEKTIWYFREVLVKSGKMDILFEEFRSFLLDKGVIAESGTIIDASFVEAPKQRNTREENRDIKEGTTPKEWSENKLRQKDVDARWMTKSGVRHYGYKNHIKVDKKSKLVHRYTVTPASTHDSQVLEELLTASDAHHELYADSAYSGGPIEKILKENNIRNRIHEKGYRGSPLTEKQKARNKIKSKIRVRVEHVFGCIVNSFKGNFIRTIGIERAATVIGMTNLTYNMVRYTQLCGT